MDVKNTKAPSDFRMSLHGIPYDQTVAAEPPRMKSTSSSKPPLDASDTSPLATHRDLLKPSNSTSKGQQAEDESHTKSDAPFLLSSSTRGSQTSVTTNDRAPSSLTSAPSVPQIRIEEDESVSTNEDAGGRNWLSLKPTRSRSEEKDVRQTPTTKETFLGLTLDLPEGALGDELQTGNMKFSNRGSMLLDGRKINTSGTGSEADSASRPIMGTKRIPTSSSVPERLPPRVMSTDEEMLSEKVRSFYAVGTDSAPQDADTQSTMAKKMGLRWQDALSSENESESVSVRTLSRAPSTSEMRAPSSPGLKPPDSPIVREEHELAGGLEDWQDVDNAFVDRYGFIVPRSPTIPTSDDGIGVKRSATGNGPGLQRVSTSLQLASEIPRRKHTIRRAPSSAHGENGSVSRKSSSHSTKSNGRPSSSKSTASHRYGALRAASNRLPGNRDRRLMDEAADMLTLPRSLTAGDLSRAMTYESDQSGTSSNRPTISKSTSQAARKKEAEREEKWRKMARPIPSATSKTPNNGVGGGMLFEFPSPSDAQLVSRTWKGIPDSWRGAAWHYFLSISARKNPNSLADDKLIGLFSEYQDQSSPDDVQIDIDVPRTISSHIMFRRRYRGGQRLLFRVLHAMSLHFAETGYVQGMAALAATLLAYYEEEKAFVMLVRLWEVRGLGRLYQSGFGGLMEALKDFEKDWLGDGEVAKQLTQLNVFPTAYGTKWYLTLFNYSIPFPAQLRVWDVFMLLGDDDSISNHNSGPDREEHPPLGTTLDVLHATSAALIDGMRDILLDSDFENAMKVLTSWIPIRDEDLFMRVAKAEWKMHRRKH